AHNCIGRLTQAKLVNHLLEALTIFGSINRVWAGTDNRDTFSLQCTCQFQRRLATELYDHADGFFFVNDFKHVFQRDWFKEQTIRGVIVGGYGFRVAVDHNGFVAVFAHSESGVYTAVVKLDTLANTVGAATDNQNLFLVAGISFALFFISGIHVSRRSGELGGTGINPLEDRTNI